MSARASIVRTGDRIASLFMAIAAAQKKRPASRALAMRAAEKQIRYRIAFFDGERSRSLIGVSGDEVLHNKSANESADAL